MTLDEQKNTLSSSDADELTTLTQNELVPASGAQPEETSVVPAPTAPEDDPESLIAYQNLRKNRADKKRKRRIKIAAGCALAGGILAVVLGRTLFATPDDGDTDMAPQTAVVERTEFSNVISASGALKAGTTVMVIPEVDGVVEDIRVTEGQEVQKGDVLFKLKNDDLDKAVREAGQEVASAQQGVASAQREVDEAEAARTEAWAKYNEEWDEADLAHQEWEDLRDNYDSLHKKWAKAMKAADALKCSEPVNPGDAPLTLGDEPKEGDFADKSAYETAHAKWEADKKTYEAWQTSYKQYIDDLESWKAYQEALAAAGEEPQPAGEEPSYPEAPDDVSLVSAIDSAREGVTSASQAVEKANEAYEEAVAAADKRTVKAPSSGNIVELNAKVGGAVGSASTGYEDGSASSGDTLVQISNMTQMAVDIEVNEIDILNVKKGQWAKVTFSALPDVELDAQVQEVSSVASGTGGGDGGIVTFHVGLVIPNPDPQLRPGMTANVRIFTVDIKDALVIPATALVEDEDATYVELVTGEDEDGMLMTEEREVKVGARNTTDVVIESGLEEGDEVLLAAGMGDLSEMEIDLEDEER